MSCAVSVSAATSFSAVRMKTREPSVEAARKIALKAPLPPFGPVDSSVVVPFERS